MSLCQPLRSFTGHVQLSDGDPLGLLDENAHDYHALGVRRHVQGARDSGLRSDANLPDGLLDVPYVWFPDVGQSDVLDKLRYADEARTQVSGQRF